MEFKEVCALRQSVRAYKPEQITEEQLQAILAAAQAAPVAMAEYSYVHLTVVQDPAVLAKLDELFAKAVNNPEAKPTYGAPTVIVVSVPASNPDHLNGAGAGCVVENMLLAAADQGLGAVYLFGLLNAAPIPEFPALLKLPEGYKAISAAAIGVPAAPVAPRSIAPIAVDYVR